MLYACADLHLCKFVWVSRKDIEGDSVNAFSDIATAIVKDVLPEGEEKHLILAGDIFDKDKIDGFTNKHFSNVMHYLHSNNVHVYYIQGNHDVSDIPLPDSIQIGYTPIAIHMDGKGVMEIDGKKIVGLDWGPREELLEKMNAITEPVDLLVLHCAFKHLLGFEEAYALSMSDVPKNYKNLFVGDIHINDIARLPNGGDFISPGSIHACKIDEQEPKGFYRLSEVPEFIEIPYRKIRRHKIYDETTLYNLERWMGVYTDDIDEEKYAPIFEIQHTYELTEQVATLVAKYDKFKYFIKRIKQETVLRDTEVVYERATLVSALPAVLAKKDANYVFLESLLTGDAETIIEKELEKVL